MKEAMLSFIRETDSPVGLLLIDPVTGFGKTHEAIETICEYMSRSEFGPARPILYLTPQLKNIHEVYEGLRMKIADESVFNNRVLNIQSNYDYLESAFLQLSNADDPSFTEDELPNEIRTSTAYLKLKDSFKHAKRLADAGFRNEAEGKREEIATSWDKNLRHEIRSFLTHELSGIDEQKARENGKSDESKGYTLDELRVFAEAYHPWVFKFYPHTSYKKYSVILMSFAKFIGRMNTPFEHRQVADCFPEEETIILIDEFDSTKDVLRDDILKNRIRFDMNTFFTRIYYPLKEHQFKSIDRTSADFVSLLKRANAIYQDYHLNCNYVSAKEAESSYLPQKQKILFHDNYFFSPVEASRTSRYINAAYLPEREAVEISYTQKEQEEQSGVEKISLTGLLRRMENFFADLQDYIDTCAVQYQNQENAKREASAKKAKKKFVKKMDKAEALSTIYNELGLNDEEDRAYREYLSKLAALRKAARFRSNKAMKNGHKISEFSFYNKGFSYYAFRDDDTNNERTSFAFTSIVMTPEKYLVSLCRRFKVIGLSATALVPSSFTNYNLDFLKRELGADFRTLSEKKKMLFKKVLRERYAAYREPVVLDGQGRKVDIVLETIGKTDENEMRQRYASLFPPKANRMVDQMYDGLCIQLSNVDAGNLNYFLKRYINVFEVMSRFFNNEEIRSFLCLHMPKADNGYLFRKDIFEKHFDTFKKCFHIDDAQLVFLEAESYEEKKEHIISLVGAGTKVFVMTTYATVGKGQNFKFPISQADRESTFQICPCALNDSRGNAKDFDAIYLGELTNQLVNSPVPEDGTELKALYQITEYYNCGELSYNEHMESISDVFTHKPYYRHQSELRKSKTVMAGNTAMAIQAIGRMSRTFCKKKNVFIFTTEDFLRQLDVSFLDKELLSPEMHAVVQACEQLPQCVETNKELEQKRLLNSMSITTAEFNNYLNKLVYSIWTEESVGVYQALGDYMLRHPMINLDDILPEYQAGYIHDLNGRAEYYYHQARDNHNYEISFSKESDFIFTINEVESMLTLFMRYPGAKEYMESLGYATSFGDGTHILNPVAFRNIYKGRLGELACKFIINTEFKQLGYATNLNEITDLSIFEKFDFVLAPGIFVDIKNWKDSFLRPQETELEKIRRKMEKTGARVVFYINLSSEYDKIETILIPEGGIVYFVPRLLKPTGEVDRNIIATLSEEMKRHGCINSLQ